MGCLMGQEKGSETYALHIHEIIAALDINTFLISSDFSLKTDNKYTRK